MKYYRRMGTNQKAFLACVLAGFLLMVLYFRLLTPTPPLCNEGHYSFISFLTSIVLGYHRSRWLIYVCDYGKSCGELPQRLDGIMSAYMLSVLSGRQFGIIFNKPVPLQELFQPAQVNWIVDPSSLVFHSCNYYNDISHGNLSETLRTQDLDSVFSEEVVYVKLKRYYWSSLYGNSRYQDKVRGLGYTGPGTFYRTFVALFQPREDFRKNISRYTNTFKSNLASRLVCVLTGGRQGERTTEWHGLWKFLNKFKASGDTRILMSTDDVDAALDGKTKYPNQFVSIPGSTRRIDQDHAVLPRSKKARENLEVNFQDFYTLIQCNDLVMLCGSELGRIVAYARNSNEGLYYFQAGDVRQTDLGILAMDYDENSCVVRKNKKVASLAKVDQSQKAVP